MRKKWPLESNETNKLSQLSLSVSPAWLQTVVSSPCGPPAVADGDEWNKEDCLTLLERIRSLLPDGDAMKYKTTESHFDWEKVCFGSFTGDMCKQKWQKVSNEVRKYRTMTELIIDAIEYVKNPYKGKKLKTHPDFPKKPLTPYFRFFMEKRAKYAKIHPEMSNLDLTKILSKKYKELTEKKKLKYIQEFQREKESFEKNMARFKEEHPELIEERKKSDLPEKPKTPQQLWYNHEKKAYMKLHPDVGQKELKEALRRQWSQLSDKKRLKWISKALELQKDYEDSMRAYNEAHPDSNADEHVKSVLTKAERQLKDKFDGRPTKPPPNGYSLYCAELMVNMKDVPSTERMVLCSKQWKMMTQKEKDMFQKRCEQKKKQYEMDLQRFLEYEQALLSYGFITGLVYLSPSPPKLPVFQSLPEEERERVLTEEKLAGTRLAMGTAGSPHRAKSPLSKERTRDPDLDQWVHGLAKKMRDGRKRSRLPETPKTAEEMWQQSVIGDYLAKYRVRGQSVVLKGGALSTAQWCYMWPPLFHRQQPSGCGNNDRKKAQNAMESAWRTMEKKEKIPWIKKAAEDQKRYEVQYSTVCLEEISEWDITLLGPLHRGDIRVGYHSAWSSAQRRYQSQMSLCFVLCKEEMESDVTLFRELLDTRTSHSGQSKGKARFDGEPKKPPVSGYQMFSQELLTNGELNHFSLKERMVEIGKRWHKLSQNQKDKYKKIVEEQQIEYKAELEAWVKSLSPQERAVYKEVSSTAGVASVTIHYSLYRQLRQKRRSTTKARGPRAKVQITKGKAVGATAAGLGSGGGRRSMAYRAKVTSTHTETLHSVGQEESRVHGVEVWGWGLWRGVEQGRGNQQDTSDSDDDEEKTDSSDSEEEEEEESSGSSDSDDDDEVSILPKDDDEDNEDEDDDDDDDEDEDQSDGTSSSTDDSSETDSD
ncbi:hypothetical protein JZ751_004154 [Albula glossodonta]|uniref:HMG box domain-containing protein n=1 Tax=Albula glossodonta TaxID=121402 RepID=A0A8T2P6H7_9TELE|nr:hypothetical protein JZ751_004154 [Albula glossodonta]